MTARCLSVVFAALALFFAANASAHTVGISRGEYLWKDGTLFAGVSFARKELATSLPHLLDRGGDDDFIGFENHREALGAWLIERLDVRTHGKACTARFGGMRFDGDGLALAVAYACDGAAETIEVDARFPAELARGHRHLATLSRGEDVWEDVASAARPNLRFELAEPPPPEREKRTFFPLLVMGLEHIFTGYDHLLFLFGLVLIGGPLRSLIAAVTAFTVAHSVTLALAAFDVWAPSPSVIEPCIALSIVYVGVENWFVKDARGRWRITFLFGLVHGFGFAGALRDIALPRADVPLALFGFNLGVELGQVAVLSVLLAVVLAVRKTAIWGRIGMRACTMTVAATGLVWFVARLRDGS
ncbi:MAG: HupE/UreJ family protein [Polyangiaceae bacterium]